MSEQTILRKENQMFHFIKHYLSPGVFSILVLAAYVGADTPVASAQTYNIKNLGTLCSCHTEVSA